MYGARQPQARTQSKGPCGGEPAEPTGYFYQMRSERKAGPDPVTPGGQWLVTQQISKGDRPLTMSLSSHILWARSVLGEPAARLSPLELPGQDPLSHWLFQCQEIKPISGLLNTSPLPRVFLCAST